MFGFTQSSACALRVVVSLMPTLLLTACIGVTRAPAPTTIPPNLPGALQAYAVGDIADCRRSTPAESMAARTAALVPEGELVLALGDMAYQYADAATLASCYEPTWGLHRRTTVAVPGNHDYVAGDASAFVDYFRPASAPGAGFIAHARRLTDHWLLVAMDSNVSGSALEAQYRWLDESLAAERARGDAQDCVLVMWHAPLYSSGLHRGSGDHMRRFWRLIDEYGADVVLSGHEHFYERFGPLDADGRAPLDGEAPRQFVVGTGGTRLFGFWKPPYRSESRVLQHGVLKLSLAPGAVAWQFVDVDGRVRDAGQARCRAAG